jgi:hypothetical protein
MANLAQHYVLTQDTHFVSVIAFMQANHLNYEQHLNRTRFWIDPDSALYTEFLLRFGHSCPRVDPALDLATGLKL